MRLYMLLNAIAFFESLSLRLFLLNEGQIKIKSSLPACLLILLSNTIPPLVQNLSLYISLIVIVVTELLFLLQIFPLIPSTVFGTLELGLLLTQVAVYYFVVDVGSSCVGGLTAFTLDLLPL